MTKLKKNSSFRFSGTRTSYGDPQELTDRVREVLKDKKPIADKSTEKTTSTETSNDSTSEKSRATTDSTTTTSNESDEELEKRSKI